MQIRKFRPEDHFVKALVYGASGAGKTYFAGTAKKAIFASAEGGLLSIADKTPDFAEIHSMRDLLELYNHLHKELAAGKCQWDTVVIDSISEINDVIIGEIEKKTGRKMQIQDWGELAQKIKKVLRDFRNLPMNVLFIAQEAPEKDGDKIKKIVPMLSGKSATGIAYFMDIVGYMKVENDGVRRIITAPDPLLLTKSRCALLGNDTEPDFSVWIEKISKMETGKQETLVDLGEITPDQGSEIAHLWDEFVKMSGTERAKSEAVKTATLKKLYGKESTTELNIEEAQEFIDRLKKKNKELMKDVADDLVDDEEKEEKKDEKKSDISEGEQATIDDLTDTMTGKPDTEKPEAKAAAKK